MIENQNERGSNMNKQETERHDAIELLRKNIQPGDTLYTVLRHTSKSGMYHVIDVYTMKDNTPLRWSWSVASAINCRYDRKHEGIGVSGCGMDMGFDIVYNLGYALFGKDYKCPGKKCGSPEHHHNQGNKPYLKGIKHTDGGYALNHRWM